LPVKTAVILGMYIFRPHMIEWCIFLKSPLIRSGSWPSRWKFPTHGVHAVCCRLTARLLVKRLDPRRRPAQQPPGVQTAAGCILPWRLEESPISGGRVFRAEYQNRLRVD